MSNMQYFSKRIKPDTFNKKTMLKRTIWVKLIWSQRSFSKLVNTVQPLLELLYYIILELKILKNTIEIKPDFSR